MTTRTGQGRSRAEVLRRFGALDEMLAADEAVALHEVERAAAARSTLDAPLAKLAVRLAGHAARLAAEEGAAARVGAATLAAERVVEARAALRAAREAVASSDEAQVAGLVDVEGFWPGGGGDMPPVARLATVGAAIRSRAAAARAATRARETEREGARTVLDRLEREGRQVAAVLRRAERDGVFGEMADRGRMLLGVPGSGPRRPGRPAWPVHVPRWNADGEATKRRERRAGAERFLAMLHRAGSSSAATLQAWPPRDGDLRVLAVSEAMGRKMAARREGDRPGGRPGSPPVTRDGAVFRVAAEAADAFGERYPTRLPLLASLTGRRLLASLPFVPIPRPLRDRNVRTYFAPEEWDALSGNLVSLRGGRCAVCGSENGHLNGNGWFSVADRLNGRLRAAAPNRKIDVHEAWEFAVREDGVGVHKLVSLLPVCTDCHMVFHADQVRRDAGAFAGRIGEDPDACGRAALDYIVDRRAAMLVGVAECPYATAEHLILAEAEIAGRLAAAAPADGWVMDLSGLRCLGLSGGDPALAEGVDPILVAGLDIRGADGHHHPAADVGTRATQLAAARAAAPAKPSAPAWTFA